jgi:hypothetical protein|tara:strand:- start:2474 stop:3667 length:1194 start_codon:yes stop_codon:yes gene_type:complete
MAVTKKKKSINYRVKTGLAAAPLDKGFEAFKAYCYSDIDRKEMVLIMKAYVKATYPKAKAAAVLAAPEHMYTVRVHVGAAMQWVNYGLQFVPRTVKRKVLLTDGRTIMREEEFFYNGQEAIDRFVNEAMPVGEEILKAKALEKKLEDNTPAVAVVTPLQRYQQKLNETIFVDLDDLEEEWINGEEPEFDLYNRLRLHGLTGKAADSVRKLLEGWLLDYTDSYNKVCEQAVEGYAHIKRTVMRRRIKHIELMLADCDKMKAASAATRKVSKPKVKSADKQITKLKFKKDDSEFKVVSINPILIIGAMRLYTFNAKTRELTEYVSRLADGFAVKGTTLQGIDEEVSRKIRLRKPEDLLPTVLSKTNKQINTAWDKLTTKQSKPNGRINDDTVLLKVMAK